MFCAGDEREGWSILWSHSTCAAVQWKTSQLYGGAPFRRGDGWHQLISDVVCVCGWVGVYVCVCVSKVNF